METKITLAPAKLETVCRASGLYEIYDAEKLRSNKCVTVPLAVFDHGQDQSREWRDVTVKQVAERMAQSYNAFETFTKLLEEARERLTYHCDETTKRLCAERIAEALKESGHWAK